MERLSKVILALVLLPLICSAQWTIGSRSFVRPTSGGGGTVPSVVHSDTVPTSTGRDGGLDLSNAVTVGNIIVVELYGGNAGSALTVADTLGNTFTTLASTALATDDDTVAIACAPITIGGGDKLNVFNGGSSASMRAMVYEVAGATCTQDVSAVSVNTLTATSCNSGPITTTTSNDFLVAACGDDGTNPSDLTPGTGWSNGINVFGGLLVLFAETRVAASPGTYTATSSTFPSEEQATLLVALKSK